MRVWVFCQWCVHAWSYCCRGFVEAYRDLLESMCEACNIRLGSQVWRHVNCASVCMYGCSQNQGCIAIGIFLIARYTGTIHTPPHLQNLASKSLHKINHANSVLPCRAVLRLYDSRPQMHTSLTKPLTLYRP